MSVRAEATATTLAEVHRLLALGIAAGADGRLTTAVSVLEQALRLLGLNPRRRVDPAVQGAAQPNRIGTCWPPGSWSVWRFHGTSWAAMPRPARRSTTPSCY